MMDAFLHQLKVSLQLHFRNRMALIYSYIFPTIFLIAFWVLYRYERVPLARHMGELLTVTALGGACFGLPTTMVSERERGVWRRYRLAPVATGTLLASPVVARYVLLILAAVLQVLINGAILGAVYALIALGLTMVFSIMRVVNFAHGQMYMLGGFVVYYLYGQYEWPFYLALPAAAWAQLDALLTELEKFLLKHLGAGTLAAAETPAAQSP